MSRGNRDETRRARALRAAKVVAMGAVVAGASGCYATTSEHDDAGPRADAFVQPDAPCSFSTPPTTQAACDGCGFVWDTSTGTCLVAVPGPFVPPAMA
jgi:hypothetical protein